MRRPVPPFLDTPTPHAFAHRGGTEAGVENALSAFEAVLRLGYRYVETDVRTTSDGVPVVFHDEDAGRLTGSAARIGDLTLAQVQALSLRGGERVATLEDALGAFPGLRFNIDLKDDAAVGAVPPVLARTAARDRVCVTSFDERRVRRARRALGPQVCTGLGRAGVLAALAAGTLRLPWWGSGAVLQVPWVPARGRTLPRAAVEAGHRAGLVVHVWTVDEPAQMHAALDLGVDGVMTDRPAVLRDVLLARGQWT